MTMARQLSRCALPATVAGEESGSGGPFPSLQASSAGGARLVCWEQNSSADHSWARDLLVEEVSFGELLQLVAVVGATARRDASLRLVKPNCRAPCSRASHELMML
jgi:hypothetical protein